jgi:hypothetical protein
VIYAGRDLTPTPITVVGGAGRFTNVAKRVTFNPEPYLRFDMKFKNNWQDSFGAAFTDVNGDFSGYPGYTIVSMDNPDLNKSMNYGSGCIPLMRESAFACDSEVAHIRFTGSSTFVFDIARSDGPMVDFVPGVVGKHLNKFPVLINDPKQFYYILTNLDFGGKGAMKFFFESELGSLSPIVEVRSIVNAPCSPRRLEISGFKKVRNLQRVMSATQNAYAVENNSFYFRIKATDRTPNLYADAPQGNMLAIISCR